MWLIATPSALNQNPTAQQVYLYVTDTWIRQTEVIDGSLLVSGTVTADNVVANVSMTSPTITGGTLQTASSGARVVINSSGFQLINASGIVVVEMMT